MKETFLSTYEVMINPMPSTNEWLQIDFDPILPPTGEFKLESQKKQGKGQLMNHEMHTDLEELVTTRCSNCHHGVIIVRDSKGQ